MICRPIALIIMLSHWSRRACNKAVKRTRKKRAPFTAGVTWLPTFGKSKIGNQENGNIGVMLKANITITGKFTCLGTQLIEAVLSGAKLKINSSQPWRSFFFVRSVKPKFQSTITRNRANQQPQPLFHPLPSIKGFVNLLATIFKSGRVTNGLCRMSCYAGHLTAWR